VIRATGLVPLAARAVRELIRGLRDARRSVVLCTHDLDEAERLADTVAILSRGRPVACDAAAWRVLPPWLVAATALLVPTVTCFAAVVASLVSSRVRTFNAAQQLGGLVLMPVWGLAFALAARLPDWGPAALFGAAAGLLLLDGAIAVLAAATWRREDVLANR
jgi:energy-coupling factor transporter ATP-binding protein EcfA2